MGCFGFLGRLILYSNGFQHDLQHSVPYNWWLLCKFEFIMVGLWLLNYKCYLHPVRSC